MRRILRFPAVPVPQHRQAVYLQQAPPPHHVAAIHAAPVAQYAGYPEEYYEEGSDYYYSDTPAYAPVTRTPVSHPNFQAYHRGPRFPRPPQRVSKDRFQQPAVVQIGGDEDTFDGETGDATGGVEQEEESFQGSEVSEAPPQEKKKDSVTRKPGKKSAEQQHVSITITENKAQVEARPRSKKKSSEKRSSQDAPSDNKAESDSKAQNKSETTSPPVPPASQKPAQAAKPPAAKDAAVDPPKPEAKKPTSALPPGTANASPNKGTGQVTAVSQKNNSSKEEQSSDKLQETDGHDNDEKPRISIPYSQLYDSKATLALYGKKSTVDTQAEPNSLDKLKWVICCCCKKEEQNPESMHPDASPKPDPPKKEEAKPPPPPKPPRPEPEDPSEENTPGRETVIRLEIGDTGSQVDGKDDDASSVSSFESTQMSEDDEVSNQSDGPSGEDDD